jgi:DNA-binding GntR family transcriptional regulator
MTPEAIADVLRQGIRENVLEPGSPLIQEDLAKRFGVSRNPVREALRTLVSEGLVSMPQGEGATVRRLSLDDLAEIYDLRIAMEPVIAELVVAEARPRDVAELRNLATRMADEADTAAWMRSNFAFHRAIYRLAGRARTETLLTGLLSAGQPYSQENVAQLGGRPQADDEHAAMADAIEAGDSARLATLLVDHLRAAKDRLSQAHADAGADDPLLRLR